jgi:arabinan endo-1,5-alpha-L-arabinosidase
VAPVASQERHPPPEGTQSDNLPAKWPCTVLRQARTYAIIYSLLHGPSVLARQCYRDGEWHAFPSSYYPNSHQNGGHLGGELASRAGTTTATDNRLVKVSLNLLKEEVSVQQQARMIQNGFPVMKKILLILTIHSLVASGGACASEQPPSPGKDPKASIPRIAGEYVNVYKPGGDIFPGPNVAKLIAGQSYDDWVPNDHCFVRDESGRWHAFGITHPLTDLSNVHAGEQLLFHAIAPPGALKEALKEGSWKDLRKVLPPFERPGEMPAIHAPWILKRNGLFHMVYGPTPIRYAVSKDLSKWTPMGSLQGAPSGRDPQAFVWNDIYHLIVCGVHDVRVATSRDFQTWTERVPILGMKKGVDPESPSIVRYNDTFFLFVCGWNGEWDRKDVKGAYQHKTYIYQSDDPLKFGLDNEVAVIDAHAPEIFQDEAGDWFISSVEWPYRGVSIAHLVWE